MSFLNKIASLFVETEEDENEETVQQEHTEKEIPIIKEEVVEEIKEVKKEEIIPEKKSVFLDVNYKTEKKPEVTINKTYEFSPIISPIFGANKDDIITRKVTEAPKTKKPSRLGTIISPIYGVVNADEIPITPFEDKEAESKIVNYSLDDIIEKNQDEDEQEVAISLSNENETIEDNNVEILPDYELMENIGDEDIDLAFKEIDDNFGLSENVDDIYLEQNNEDYMENEDESEESINVIEEFVLEKEDSEPTAQFSTKVDKTEEIKKVMKEYSEEEIFARDNQPSLFDL